MVRHDNVFAALNLPDADEWLAKAELARAIQRLIGTDPGSHSDTSGGGARRRAIGHVEPRTWPARRIFDGTVHGAFCAETPSQPRGCDYIMI